MIKFFYAISFLIFLSTNVSAQKKQAGKYAFCQKLDNNYSFVFLKFNKAFNLYSSPRILWQKKLIKIKDFDEENFSGVKLNIAPNKKYIVMDNIIKGYVQTEKDSALHENYTCVIVDIKKAKVIMSMQTDCGGNWNKNNEWKNNNKLLFKARDF